MHLESNLRIADLAVHRFKRYTEMRRNYNRYLNNILTTHCIGNYFYYPFQNRTFLKIVSASLLRNIVTDGLENINVQWNFRPVALQQCRWSVVTRNRGGITTPFYIFESIPFCHVTKIVSIIPLKKISQKYCHVLMSFL